MNALSITRRRIAADHINQAGEYRRRAVALGTYCQSAREGYLDLVRLKLGWARAELAYVKQDGWKLP